MIHRGVLFFVSIVGFNYKDEAGEYRHREKDYNYGVHDLI
jgi:hypothetical protein